MREMISDQAKITKTPFQHGNKRRTELTSELLVNKSCRKIICLFFHAPSRAESLVHKNAVYVCTVYALCACITEEP